MRDITEASRFPQRHDSTIIKNVGIALLIGLISATTASAAPDGCREGFFLELPDADKTIHGVPSSATFVVTPEQRLGPGQFYAKVHGSLIAEIAIAGKDFICEYDVGPSCPQLGELVSRIKTFAPSVGTGYGETLESAMMHATRYQFEIRDGRGVKASFFSHGWSTDPVKTFVASSRELLEACMPADVASFAKSRLRKIP